LGGYSNLIALLSHAPFENRGNLKLFSDFLEIHIFPLNWNDDVRPALFRSLIEAREFNISSAIPSLKYS